MRECIEVIETWTLIDKWWRPEEEQIRREYAEVKWNGRRLIFIREAPDKVWRIGRIKL